MRKIYFYLFIFSLLFFFNACKDEEKEGYDEEIANLNCPVSPIHGKIDNITGKWKLIKTTETKISAPTSVDYSCEDIIFEFRSDNKLIVTSSIDGQLKGEYKYEYKIPVVCPTCLPSANLYIENAPFYGTVSANKLKMVSPQETPINSDFQKHHRVLVRVK